MLTDTPTPWFVLANAALGTEEVPGAASNPDIDAYFADAGHPGMRDDVAWCSAFVASCLARAGYPTTGSLAARSWLNYGRELETPEPGCIVVFWRNSKDSWEGHVAFLVADEGDYVRVIGGNQANAVTVATYPKYRVLGYRMPVLPAEQKGDTPMSATATAPAKPASASLTVWGAITGAAAMVVPTVAGIFGIDMTADMVSALLGAIGTIMAVIGRLNASSGIGGMFKA